MPQVSAEAGSSAILGAVLLEGGELPGRAVRDAGAGRGGGTRGAGAEHGERPTVEEKCLISIIRKKVFISVWIFWLAKSYGQVVDRLGRRMPGWMAGCGGG